MVRPYLVGMSTTQQFTFLNVQQCMHANVHMCNHPHNQVRGLLKVLQDQSQHLKAIPTINDLKTIGVGEQWERHTGLEPGYPDVKTTRQTRSRSASSW